MSHELAATLAPTGTLRAGVNLGNFLLITGRTEAGDPQGVSPDMAGAVAQRLGVPVEYVPYATPGEVADAATEEAWDIALIGAEPARAEHIAFTAAYVEIESTYLVPAGSPIESIDAVDQPGIRIAVSARSAYDLWLERNIKHAELVRAKGLDASFELFVAEKLDVLAGLRPRLATEVEKLPGARVLPGKFSRYSRLSARQSREATRRPRFSQSSLSRPSQAGWSRVCSSATQWWASCRSRRQPETSAPKKPGRKGIAGAMAEILALRTRKLCLQGCHR